MGCFRNYFTYTCILSTVLTCYISNIGGSVSGELHRKNTLFINAGYGIYMSTFFYQFCSAWRGKVFRI